MDHNARATSLVHQTLAHGENEKCLMCLRGKLLLDRSEGKLDKYIALIERKGDHSIFLFSSTQVPCVTVEDLILEEVFPVDSKLQYTTEQPKKSASGSAGGKTFVVLGLRVEERLFLIEIPNDASSQKFLLELKRATSAQSVTASFGLPSSFTWLDKYRALIANRPCESPPPDKNDDCGNPFANDVFDPLQYMNIATNVPPPPVQVQAAPSINIQEKTAKPSLPPPPKPSQSASAKVRHTTPGAGTSLEMMNVLESSNSTFYAFDDNFTDSNVGSAFHPMRKSMSKDSLDNLDDKSEFTDSLSKITQQLGLGGSGVEMIEGLKPTTGRENIVRHFMNEREDEFTYKKTLKVFCGTWNVNGQSPPVAIKKWLDVDSHPADIYAIGFQELDLSNQAYIFSDSHKETEWLNAVRKSLPSKFLYKKVKLIRLVGVMLIVYIREKYAERVHFIDSDTVATGIMGIMGNKGGVGVRFTIEGTSICFINSHLAAHQEEFERRNQDYRDIDAKMRFKQFVPPLTIQDHDIVFWIGDLNYRIVDLDIDKVKSLIDKKKFTDLLAYDQLHRQLGRTDVFRGYKEGDITFQPTYKYDPGTNDWDTSEKCRIPAWCDRVLFRAAPADITLVEYRYHPQLKVSDHKPVSTISNVQIRVIDVAKSKKVYEDIMKKLDRLENDYLPQLKLDKMEFHFQDVKFMEVQDQYINVENIGQVPVTFEFIKKLDEPSHCKPWMEVTPCSAVLPPGKQRRIQVKVYVDETTVGKLSVGEDKVEDILVLHLHGGKDFFITVTGNYIPSSFGSSIEALIQMHGPIREVPVAQLVEIEQPGSLQKRDVEASGGRLYAVPKEIWRLVDHIWKNGRTQEFLFERTWLQNEVVQIRDCLDTGAPDVVPGSIHSVAAALLLFLKCLPDPVIPYSVYKRCIDCSNNYMLCKQVLAQIPECHRNVFRYLCSFLRELLANSKDNNLDIKLLATSFGKIFLRPPPDKPLTNVKVVRRDANLAKGEEDMKRAAFVYHFLHNEYDE